MLCVSHRRVKEAKNCRLTSSFDPVRKCAQAVVGLMTVQGPFARSHLCTIGRSCAVALSGIGLASLDLLLVSAGDCGSGSAFSHLEAVPLQRREGSGSDLEASLGTLPSDARPGIYQLCWCARGSHCEQSGRFGAPSGLLVAACPPGSFTNEHLATCSRCTRGYFCPGRLKTSAFVACLPREHQSCSCCSCNSNCS